MMMYSKNWWVLVVMFPFLSLALGDADSEKLLEFRESLANHSSLSNWNASTSPCQGNKANWMGVICDEGKVWGLQLENMGLQGHVNVEILTALPTLRTLSLMNNHFEGAMFNVRKLSALKALYLSGNRFTGDIPDDAFKGMRSLKKVLLANNGFTGKIPSSLTTLPNLLMLRLEGNQFSGGIPDFKQNLKVASFANNRLEGPIPASLNHMGATMFSGNKNLCGKPLQACGPMRSPKNHIFTYTPEEKTPPILNLVLILISVLLLLLLLIISTLVLMFVSPRNKNPQTLQGTNVVDSREKKVAVKSLEHGKLTFLKHVDTSQRFGLQDLLRASAEVLGSGNFAASYKVVMVMYDEPVVVKRHKQMNNGGKEDFDEHMRRLGRLNHQNLLPLAAYHYMTDEKLLVSKYMENGSLATHLHGKDKPRLEWGIRLQIIKGVARGLSYLYKELPTLVLPHGNLKSSNVLLDDTFKPLLCDYGLTPMMNQEQVHMFMAAYKSPEYALKGRISKKTDVWCLGILILELITGKFPENYLQPNYDSETSLPSWVSEMVKEKRSNQVFDHEMMGTKDNKIGMMNLLKIGLSCCEEDLSARPELKQVVQEIEQLDDVQEIFSAIREVNLEMS
ncbi:pollen receptor like kinase 4 [Hibiscus trionum]|uniref:Pollen receptor like kinase 4 n=1 Tax=Hibiscus trionum TaxID=183268 RepID=A0A9W7HHA4_HIBTR|nr:pollen receptor like kinase 4 [Hibiscus trionum]